MRRPAGRRRSPRPGVGAAVVSLLLCLAGAVGCAPEAPPPPESAAAPPAPAPEPPQPTGPVPPWAAYADEIEPAVRDWAAAWSNQDVDAYLSRYSPSFRLPGNLTRSEWERQRKTRLTRPKRISVELSEYRRTGSGNKWISGRQVDVVEVQFRQAYQSDTYADEVLKTLELEHLDGRWLIVTERSR